MRTAHIGEGGYEKRGQEIMRVAALLNPDHLVGDPESRFDVALLGGRCYSSVENAQIPGPVSLQNRSIQDASYLRESFYISSWIVEFLGYTEGEPKLAEDERRFSFMPTDKLKSSKELLVDLIKRSPISEADLRDILLRQRGVIVETYCTYHLVDIDFFRRFNELVSALGGYEYMVICPPNERLGAFRLPRRSG